MAECVRSKLQQSCMITKMYYYNNDNTMFIHYVLYKNHIVNKGLPVIYACFDGSA